MGKDSKFSRSPECKSRIPRLLAEGPRSTIFAVLVSLLRVKDRLFYRDRPCLIKGFY